MRWQKQGIDCKGVFAPLSKNYISPNIIVCGVCSGFRDRHGRRLFFASLRWTALSSRHISPSCAVLAETQSRIALLVCAQMEPWCPRSAFVPSVAFTDRCVFGATARQGRVGSWESTRSCSCVPLMDAAVIHILANQWWLFDQEHTPTMPFKRREVVTMGLRAVLAGCPGLRR